VAAALLCGCASPTIDAWADRGLDGVALARQNTAAFRDQVARDVTAAEAVDLDEMFAEILDVASGRVKDPNGQAIALDAAWLDEHKAGYLETRADRAAHREALDAAARTAIANLDEIAVAFEQIKRLRRSIGETDELAAQVAELSALVRAMLAERRGGAK